MLCCNRASCHNQALHCSTVTEGHIVIGHCVIMGSHIMLSQHVNLPAIWWTQLLTSKPELLVMPSQPVRMQPEHSLVELLKLLTSCRFPVMFYFALRSLRFLRVGAWWVIWILLRGDELQRFGDKKCLISFREFLMLSVVLVLRCVELIDDVKKKITFNSFHKTNNYHMKSLRFLYCSGYPWRVTLNC